MYSVFNEIHPPTVIDHAVKCHFFDDNEINLVTAGATKLIVYRLFDVDEDNQKNDVPGFSDSKKKKKLEQAATYSFFGNILNLQVVRLGRNSRDSLLLAFKDAKLSIVEYDPATHDLKTDSMHFFEDQNLKAGVSYNIHAPLVRVDPENRCACMLVYGRYVVVLPFKHKVYQENSTHVNECEHIKSVLPSYMIDLKSFDSPLVNVTDFQFLHGYQDPTILLLYEPVQTAPGRIAVRQDTFCVSALSLNMTERVNPIIWTVNNLPFDCQMLKAIEKPLGGVLVFANNSLIYLNQSVPPYGVSLNSIATSSTMFPLQEQENIVITLAEACTDFISSDKLVLSLKGGEIYILTLLTDGLRSVTSFHFDKAAGSVLASCVAFVIDGFVFIGSRLGNSLLLRYTEKSEAMRVMKKTPGEPPQLKKRKVENLDDLELFGDSIESMSDIVSTYAFDVSDSLLNIGPITKTAIGEPAFLSEEFFSGNSKDLELVCCSGYGKNGALSVLQKTIRPQVVTTFELPGCTDIWTVYAKQKEDEDEQHHSFLILSREDSTLVLKTGDEISEIENSGFNTQVPTVFAGNLGLNKYVIQVCPSSVRLLDGPNELQDVPLDSELSNIVSCNIADPHSILLLADGSVVYMQLIEDFNGPKLKLLKPKIDLSSKIVCTCVYKDSSGLFNIEHQSEERQSIRSRRVSTMPTIHTATSFHQRKSISADDEDELLYGESILSNDAALQEAQLANIRRPSFAFPSMGRSKQITYWCFLCRENGTFEIYSLPDFQLVFTAIKFNDAPKVLIDCGVNGAAKINTTENEAKVKEINIVGAGHKKKRPYLFALIDQDIVIYECFPYNKSAINGHLTIRFKRLEHDILMRIKEESKLAEMADPKAAEKNTKVPRLRLATNVSNYETGLFVCGSYPYWLFISSRGAIHGHPMTVDGTISSFASFNNVNCPKGFLYFNKMGELRIAVLPSHLNYDSPWPVRKIPLRMTPYDVAYEYEAKVYAVALAYPENQKKIPRFYTEEREFDSVERESRYMYSQLDRFVLQLMSPVSWEMIPNTRMVLQEFEHVTCLKVLSLQSEMVENGYKQFLVVSTTFNYGEDIACKGRILIFDIVEVVPEPGQPLTKTKSKCLHDKEQKGPVTALCASSGFLIAAVGQKIYAYTFKNGDLVGVAFVDSQVYTVSLISIRNIIIAADISRSISLIRFQVDHRSLALVSRDSRHLETYCAEFYVHGSYVGFLVSDNEQNVLIFSYQPEALESFGGHHLLLKADFHTGSHCNTMFRVTASQDELVLTKAREKRQITYMCTLDGGINTIIPLKEKQYRRLLMLQNKLADCLQHKAGLNPRAFRALKLPLRPLTNPHKNILDGELLSKYIHMSFQERTDIAKKMGTTSSQILDDMMDIRRLSSHF